MAVKPENTVVGEITTRIRNGRGGADSVTVGRYKRDDGVTIEFFLDEESVLLEVLDGDEAIDLGRSLIRAASLVDKTITQAIAKDASIVHDAASILEKAAYFAYRLATGNGANFPWSLLSEKGKQIWRDAVLGDNTFPEDVQKGQHEERAEAAEQALNGLHNTV